MIVNINEGEPQLRRRLAPLAGAASALVLVAACSGSGDSESGRDQDTTTTSIEAGSTTTTLDITHPTDTVEGGTGSTLPGVAVERCQLSGGAREGSLRGDFTDLSPLVGIQVRLGDHEADCYERVAFQYDTSFPLDDVLKTGVNARYVETPMFGESDQPADLPEGAYLEIASNSWMYPESTNHAGPDRVTSAHTDLIQEVVMIENYEGYAKWVVVLPEELDFTVGEVSGTTDCPDLCITVDIEDNRG